MIAYDRRTFKGLPEVDKIDVQRGVSLLDGVPQSEDLIYASQPLVNPVCPCLSLVSITASILLKRILSNRSFYFCKSPAVS